MHYQEVTEQTVDLWAPLEARMFDLQPQEALDSCLDALRSGKQSAFVALDDAGVPVGYVNASIRTDYVAGTDHSPVGFLEAIFVVPEHRKKGIAAALAGLAERWAAGRGCTEMASDALLENTVSHAFHAHIGFKEVERIVCYIRKIEGAQRP